MIKEIDVEGGTKAVTAIFGSGDIKVSNGVAGNGVTPMFAIWNGEKAEIGHKTNEGIEEDENGLPRLNRNNITFVFEKEESIDVVIKHLLECKEMFKVDPEKRVDVVASKYDKTLD